jgi:hypothetical protein
LLIYFKVESINSICKKVKMIIQLIANYQLSQIKFENTNQIKMLYILVN